MFPFDNSYARLPERFYARLPPTPVKAPKLVKLNGALARELGLDPDALMSDEGVAFLAGNAAAPGSEPIAMAYAGHQFGHFVPQLGDGRAILLGEVVDTKGMRRDIQLKGAGQTPFSRGADGRAALGPVLREYIVSEAMAALGIPTTRALAALITGEGVWRETALPGAILARVAQSHIRIGTFQFFAARGDVEALRLLVEHVLARHYPEAQGALGLLEGVIARQAALVARWMGVGFIHGVMNTDNMTVSGETIDYGPCAFMDRYHPETVFSSIDAHGRYAFANQPAIARWNLARLAETLLPLLSENEEEAVDRANAALTQFPPLFETAWRRVLGAKLGIAAMTGDDMALAGELFDAMAAHEADFTLTFRRLTDGEELGFGDWQERWRARADDPGAMARANPRVIPRNHRVEEAIRAAVDREDFAAFETLVQVLGRPFDAQPEFAAYADPPKPDEVVTRTFCGT
ncbi:MAG: YdiU family protein [Alphaproteobacteria bacterium]|nr:YdiU family protein [Alphaproteobacteria bacterium]